MRARESGWDAGSGASEAEANSNARSGYKTLFLGLICGLAVTVCADYPVTFLLGGDESFRGPSVYVGFAAILLSLPLLPEVLGMGRRLAPILLLFGSIIVSVVILVVLAARGEVRWDTDFYELDRPLKLVLTATLVAFAGESGLWRRRLTVSYLVGWAVFVAYGVYASVTDKIQFFKLAKVQHMVRVSISGLNENEQSIVVATGMVLLLAEIVNLKSMAAVPLYAGGLLAGGAIFVLGGSRSASLALLAGFLVVISGWVRGGSKQVPRRTMPIALVLVGLAVGAPVLMQRNDLVGGAVVTLEHRFGEALTGANLGNRDSLAAGAVTLARDNFFHGVGLGRARTFLGEDPHNGYLRIVAEGGVLAAILLLGAILLIGAAIVRETRLGPALGPAAALVVLMVAATAGQELFQTRLWFFLGLVVAASDGGEGH
jgi:O-antigen ligase